jgi:hypothetical protein
VWKRVWDKEGRRPEIEIVIGNAELKNLLAYCLRDLPGHRDGEQITFYEPFRPLVYSWKRLQQVASNNTDQEPGVAKDDLKSLLELVEGSKALKLYFDGLENYTKDKTISWEYLWTIFPPGQLIFGTPFDVPQAFLVADCDFVPYDRDDEDRVAISCWTYGSTAHGSPFQGQLNLTDRVRQILTGRSFNVTITISTLASMSALDPLTRCLAILWNSMRTRRR